MLMASDVKVYTHRIQRIGRRECVCVESREDTLESDSGQLLLRRKGDREKAMRKKLHGSGMNE
jgi:hypothetical protein